MIKEQFKAQVEAKLGYFPTFEQQKMVESIYDFLLEEDAVFLLKGYAGTGKSSMISAVIRTLKLDSWNVVLLAPTGRAARIFADFALLPATTIHRKIYKQDTEVAQIQYKPVHNMHTHTVFVVDEASMISNRMNEFSQSSILDDLMEYVYEGDDCRLILVGDTAQLPPIGQSDSLALDANYIEKYGLQVFSFELTEVVRQEADSGILMIATQLREYIERNDCSELHPLKLDFDDVHLVDSYSMQDVIENSLRDSENEFLIITRANWAANSYNQYIRFFILGREEMISNNDRVVVVKNNYKWLVDYLNDEGYEHLNKLSFIANGDTARIIRVRSIREKYGFHFADASLWLEDQNVEIDAYLMLSTLNSKSPSLSKEDLATLWERIVEQDHQGASKSALMKEMKHNPYLNALQVKFAYALTCHKAQGGQWNEVYVDLDGLRKDMIGVDFYRWLYTAVTRARKGLYFLNLPEEMNANRKI